MQLALEEPIDRYLGTVWVVARIPPVFVHDLASIKDQLNRVGLGNLDDSVADNLEGSVVSENPPDSPYDSTGSGPTRRNSHFSTAACRAGSSPD
jgi:hypothetical protein